MPRRPSSRRPPYLDEYGRRLPPDFPPDEEPLDDYSIPLEEGFATTASSVGATGRPQNVFGEGERYRRALESPPEPPPRPGILRKLLAAGVGAAEGAMRNTPNQIDPRVAAQARQRITQGDYPERLEAWERSLPLLREQYDVGRQQREDDLKHQEFKQRQEDLRRTRDQTDEDRDERRKLALSAAEREEGKAGYLPLPPPGATPQLPPRGARGVEGLMPQAYDPLPPRVPSGSARMTGARGTELYRPPETGKVKLSAEEVAMAEEKDIALPTPNEKDEYWMDAPSYRAFTRTISRVEKEPKIRWTDHTDDRGNVTSVGIDEQTGKEVGRKILGKLGKSKSEPQRPESSELIGVVLQDQTGGVYEGLTPTQRAIILPQLAAAGWKYQGKPLSPEAQKTRENAASGIRAIAKVRGMLKQDPAVLLKAAIPGSPGAREFLAARNEVMDVVTRLRTGAALNTQEEEFYKQQVPTLMDLSDPNAIEYKLGMLETLFGGLSGPRRQFESGPSGAAPKAKKRYNPQTGKIEDVQ